MITRLQGLRRILGTVILVSLFSSCVEPIEIQTETYENALVIEGTITDELSHQEILISRTYKLGETGPSRESNATVRVTGNSTLYEFIEEEPGRYLSIQPFRAEQGISYTLEIRTADGKQYSSEPEELPVSSNISALYAQKTTYEEETGVAILAGVEVSQAASGYYLYDFVETYKIVSPYQINLDLKVIDGEFVEVEKTREETVCYTTEVSKEVILANTNAQSGNDLEANLIKFIPGESHKTAHRYSILVRQFSISAETYSYYQTLRDFSESENLFSQNQLGLINGNIFSISDPDEPVVGIFSVAGVSRKRIFFNFEDFYDRDDFIPNAHVECEVLFPPTLTRSQRESIGEQLKVGSLKYFGFEMGGGYRFAKAGCLDCTKYGSNIAPDFWEE
ncbi:DUF4249 domain-containing protein [Salinimicrobium sp. HB62]|uniref:DUF4249 domain-containing protein n=1 Tax=Salinimicrobium sp. HB62 TaxID=3077781 RepID=UPI002D768B76|nr:DUF4249 domain-containing protein [Salinimicrobium sp. HB62]